MGIVPQRGQRDLQKVRINYGGLAGVCSVCQERVVAWARREIRDRERNKTEAVNRRRKKQEP